MSLDKSIDYGKDWREPYRKAKAVDKHCRNHGYCPRCRNNRLYSSKKTMEAFKEQLKEIE